MGQTSCTPKFIIVGYIYICPKQDTLESVTMLEERQSEVEYKAFFSPSVGRGLNLEPHTCRHVAPLVVHSLNQSFLCVWYIHAY